MHGVGARGEAVGDETLASVGEETYSIVGGEVVLEQTLLLLGDHLTVLLYYTSPLSRVR